MTKNELIEQIKNLGIENGMKVLVHTAFSKVGKVEDGPEALISAIKEVVTPNGKKIPFHDVAYQEEDFNEVGTAFEKVYKNDSSAFRTGKIGNAECKLINQHTFVDFAVKWMERNRS